MHTWGFFPCPWFSWREPLHVRVGPGRRTEGRCMGLEGEDSNRQVGGRLPRGPKGTQSQLITPIPYPRVEPAWEGWNGDLGTMTLSWPCGESG